MRTRRLLIVFTAVVAIIPVSASSTPATAAPELGALPPGTPVQGLSSFADALVAAGHLFLAEGDGGSDVAIFNMAGRQVGEVHDIPSPVALATTGSKLFVAARDVSAVYVYDVSALPPTGPTVLSTLPIHAPTSLAISSGLLWFQGKGGTDGSQGLLGSMTTSGSNVHRYLSNNNELWQYFGVCGDMDESAIVPDRLFLHGLSRCGSSDVLYAYDSSTAPPTELATFSSADWGNYGSQSVAFLPDGSGILIGAPGGLEERSTDDLSGPLFTYETGGRSSPFVGEAIATAAPDSIAASAFVRGGPALLTWHVGEVLPQEGWRIPQAEQGIMRNGLVYNGLGTKIFAVTGTQTQILVHMIDPSIKYAPLSLHSSKKSLIFGEAATLTATLSGPDPGQVISILYERGHASDPVGSCTTGSDGACSWTGALARSGSYRATFQGAGEWEPSESQDVNVAVAAGLDTEMKRFYGRSHQWVLYRENGRIVYEARVEPPTPGQKIRIELDQRHHGHWASAGHHGFVENHQGIVRLRFKRGGLPEGGRFRFRSSVGASPNLEGASSDWSLFRITR